MRKAILFGVFGAITLAGLFWLYRLLSPDAPRMVLPAQTPPVVAANTAPQAVVVEIRQGRRVQGPGVIRIAQGDTLRLVLTSDVDAELHLHGYDRHVHLQAGKPVELSLVAEHGGRFEYELHGAGQGGHQALGVIEVLPQ